MFDESLLLVGEVLGWAATGICDLRLVALTHLAAVLDQLFGEPEGESKQVGYVLPAKQHNFRHQRQPELLLSPAAGASGGGSVLQNGDCRRVYYNERLVNTPFPDEAGLPRGVLMGVHAFIALDNTQTLAVVPATHQSSTPLPPGHEPPLGAPPPPPPCASSE